MKLTKYGGNLIKEKSYTTGCVGLIKLTDNLNVVVALDKLGNQLLSKSFPFTEESKKEVSRQSRAYFNVVSELLLKGIGLDDLEI